MESVISKIFSRNGVKITRSTTIRPISAIKCYSTNVRNIMRKPKYIHPYRKIHPWKSVEEFSKSLVASVIHNQDGLVAINKPYGISGNNQKFSKSNVESLPPTGIVKEVSYTLSDAIPYIAQELGYSTLKLINTPERFTSGIAILAADHKIQAAVEKSLRRAQGLGYLPKTYWAVTNGVPNKIKGEERLAMTMKKSPTGKSQMPIIITSWSHNNKKRKNIKILNVQFKIISNSTYNLSSLVEIKSSTKMWHSLRLFAATFLYSPILGDNIYGSRVQNVMGKLMNVSPFVEAAQVPPKLNKDLQEILKISAGNESMIPAHLHLREIFLPMCMKKDCNLVLTAPPMPEFIWTCQQLKFKHELFTMDEENDVHINEHPNPMRHEVVI